MKISAGNTKPALKTSPLKCCVMKSAAQISTQLNGTKLNGEMSSVFCKMP